MSLEEEPPAAMQAQPAIAQATITIIRAGTGKVETFDLTFIPLPEAPPAPPQQPKEAE